MKKLQKLTALLSSLAIVSSMGVISAGASEVKTYKLGDVNMDGVVNCKDLSLAKLGMCGFKSLSSTQKKLADVNGDKHINIIDTTLLTFHCAGATRINGEVTVTFDDNGNAVEYLNGNTDLTVDYSGYTAYVDNTAESSLLTLSKYYMSDQTDNSSVVVSPWTSELTYKTDATDTYLSKNDLYTTARTLFKDSNKLMCTSVSAYGNLGIRNDFVAEETAPFMQKTYNLLKNTNMNSDLFSTTGYGIDETVYLVNAEVTKRENGIEFVNHVSDDTVNAFMADDYVTIDGVTISYNEGEFTVDGIAEEEIELLNTMTVTLPKMGTYDEIAVVANTSEGRFVYGLMYDTASESMAALVKVRLDKDAEATVIQYSKPSDMATTINFYPKEGIVDYAMEHPDEMVTLFDNEYDPDHMVFQTVHFPRMTKNALIGAINARYQITNGYTYKQTAGNASIKSTHADTSSTISFSTENGVASIVNNEAGHEISITNSDTASTYKQGNESITVEGSYFNADSSIEYAYGENTETFTVNGVLDLRTPTLY